MTTNSTTETPSDTIRAAAIGIGAIESQCQAVLDHLDLLCVLTSGPDAESCMIGINRLLHVILQHAEIAKHQAEMAAGQLKRFDHGVVVLRCG